MAIFGILELEDAVQAGDKTRLSGIKSFVSKDNAAITLVRIEPHTGDGFIQVSGTGIANKDWFVDWVYATAGSKTVTIEITAGSVETFSKTISVITEATDGLWSKDSDLLKYESDILKWVPEGKSSFTNVHRQAQELILDWLDSIRIWKDDGARLEKGDMLVTSDVKQLSVYWTLALIFQNLSNKPDDVFFQKSKKYLSLVKNSKARGRIQADLNDNDVLDEGDGSDMTSFRIFRR